MLARGAYPDVTMALNAIGYQATHHANVASLCNSLISLRSGAIVAIEGFMNSGKSHLAKTLAASLSCGVVHADDFIIPSERVLPYVDRIDFDQLKAALSCSINNSPLLLVEGICLRDLLARAGVFPELYVYVKRIAENGLWHDGFHLEDYEANNCSVASEPGKSDLNYHSQSRPHEKAQIVFHRNLGPEHA